MKLQKNEVFLDVVESMSLLVNSSGQVVHSEVTGALKMRCFLSGMVRHRKGMELHAISRGVPLTHGLASRNASSVSTTR